MINVKSDQQLARMRKSNQIAADVREALADFIQPGMTTAELDRFAKDAIEKQGGVCAFKGYRGYPGHICTSVNEEVVHGIPGPRVIQIGDIVSIDIGVICDGFYGDTAATIPVGVMNPAHLRLIEVTRNALEVAIGKAVEGNRLSDISHSVEQVALAEGLTVVREFVGHGIGTEMHEPPQIPNFGPPGKGPKLKAGMTLAIEPMFNLGEPDVEILDDGWTVRTLDGEPSAHFEHTVVVGKEQAEILTVSKNAE